eukprot:10818370-Heterocapsa_arctica.AAC.1
MDYFRSHVGFCSTRELPRAGHPAGPGPCCTGSLPAARALPRHAALDALTCGVSRVAPREQKGSAAGCCA